MNYQHAFHAGNFSDVFKHLVLIILVEALKRKESPFCYVDTHAGSGCYDLLAIEAQKTGEYLQGVVKVFSQINVPAVVQTYLNIIKDLNAAELRYYPGSPWIAHKLLRKQDRMILTEFHPETAVQLKQVFFKDPRIAIHHQDGYQALKAFLPPKERRGLVLIDPPFESANEFDMIINGLKNALTRWATGIYAIWYPIKDKNITDRFIKQLVQLSGDKLFVNELLLYPTDVSTRLNGCGMAIVNTPWQVDEQIVQLTKWLENVLK